MLKVLPIDVKGELQSISQIKKIKIAIIDSGIDNRFSNGDKGRDSKDNTVLDVKGYGTHSAALAVGRKIETKLYDTFSVMIEGAAPCAEIYEYKVI
ncbi:hypothetical protein CFP56_012095 [Quercus suber]|uniref:Peptidase S8/S53 domain-containing protein n=1 Tax=Quercus suber TaxID=58331 RepID=A0AAW0KW03_QUESU